MADYSSSFSNTVTPQTQSEAVGCKQSQIDLGIPKEHLNNESRIAVAMETLLDFSYLGYSTAIEKGALQNETMENPMEESGHKIIFCDKKTAFSARIVLKVQPPTMEEAKLLPQGGILLSEIHHNSISKELFHILQNKNITWFNILDFCDPVTGDKPMKVLHQNAIATFVPYIIAHFMDLLPPKDRFTMGKTLSLPSPFAIVVGYGEAARNTIRILSGMGYKIHVMAESISSLQAIDHECPHSVEKSLLSSGNFQENISGASVVLFDLTRYHGEYFPLKRIKIAKNRIPSLWIDLSRPFYPMIEDLSETEIISFGTLTDNIWYHSCNNILSFAPNLITKQIGDFLTHCFFQPFAKHRNIITLLSENAHLHLATYFFNGNVCHRNVAQKLNTNFHDLNFFRNSLLS